MQAMVQNSPEVCPPPIDEPLPETASLTALDTNESAPLLARARNLGKECLDNFDYTGFVDTTSIRLLCLALDTYKKFDRTVIAKIIPFQ